MGMISIYCDDNEVVSSLRQQYPREDQYRINFLHWLNTARQTKDGILVQVENRKFLLHHITGQVIKEVIT